MKDTKRRLLWHGMFLFLLGLLTGFVGPPRPAWAWPPTRRTRRLQARAPGASPPFAPVRLLSRDALVGSISNLLIGLSVALLLVLALLRRERA